MNKKQIINIIIVFLVLVLIIVGLILLNKYALNSNNMTDDDNSNINENVEENISTDKVEEQEDVQPTGEENLYLVLEDNTIITAYKFETDFEEYIKKTVNPFSFDVKTEVKKQKFQEIWKLIDSDVITVKKDGTYNVTFQLSRYGYPKEDLDFDITDNYIVFYENGNFGIVESESIFYYENNKKSKKSRICEGNLGKVITAYKINGKWYIYKTNVLE